MRARPILRGVLAWRWCLANNTTSRRAGVGGAGLTPGPAPCSKFRRPLHFTGDRVALAGSTAHELTRGACQTPRAPSPSARTRCQSPRLTSAGAPRRLEHVPLPLARGDDFEHVRARTCAPHPSPSESAPPRSRCRRRARRRGQARSDSRRRRPSSSAVRRRAAPSRPPSRPRRAARTRARRRGHVG